MFLLFCICGCASLESEPTSEHEVIRRGNLHEEECNGHIYVVGIRYLKGGIYFTHSPNCECLKNNKD